jgi:hypothetical protein
MTIMRQVLEGARWWELRPATDRIRNQPTTATQRMALAVRADGAAGVAYLPDNTSIQIDMGAFTRSVQATWVSPVTGARTAGGSASPGGVATFQRPGPGDWVLLLAAQ